MTRTVGIYIYHDVEVLDFAGPFEVFATASRLHCRDRPAEPPPFSVRLIAPEPGPIAARGGMRVLPDLQLTEHPQVDVLIVAGGVVTAELTRGDLSEWLRSLDGSAEIMASVCTGAFLLAKAGLLEGRGATTHWEDIDEFSRMFPAVNAREEARWVEEGNLLTSAGISAGIDMSLHIVGRLAGEELAVRTARQMDYRWQRN